MGNYSVGRAIFVFINVSIIVFTHKNVIRFDLMRYQLHNLAMMWAVTVLVLLEDDVAMLAFMLS